MEATAHVGDINFGTGLSLFQNDILPAIESAKHEVILVTCFWAASPTRTLLGETLLKLSRTAQEQHRTVRVHIGFSSSSLAQKLFHQGPHTYDVGRCLHALGLPAALLDYSGVELEVKSTFYLPFSVWHPKFVVIDREVVFLPSCNVSWEEWFEVSVRLTGPVVSSFLDFWNDNWAATSDRGEPGFSSPTTAAVTSDEAHHIHERDSERPNIKCLFLPSPHSCNPRFAFPWQEPAAPPRTPLNVHLQELFASARHEVYLQTPNVTAPPVLDALLEALQRGVHVTISTSERLMILEQLVTAGTTTSRCMRRLTAQHRALVETRRRRRNADEEAGFLPPGTLTVAYYEPREGVPGEPVQAHAKVTIVDEAVVVFGSGNMDRASWYTSQELGVAFYSSRLAREVKARLQDETKGRREILYDTDSSAP